MITRLTKPLRRLVGDVVVEISEEGIRLRRRGCRRSVFLSFDDAIEVGINLAGYDTRSEKQPVEQLRDLRRFRQGQPRTLFARSAHP